MTSSFDRKIVNLYNLINLNNYIHRWDSPDWNFMKKIAFMLALIISPSLCFGMLEPSSSSTNIRDLTVLKRAVKEKNIPLIKALARAVPSEESLRFLKTMSQAVIYSFENIAGFSYFIEDPSEQCNTDMYTIIAPLIIEEVEERTLRAAFIAAAHDQALEKVVFLLENYRDQLDQETLNAAINQTLKTERVFSVIGHREMDEHFQETVPNPLFIYGNEKATKNNRALIELLEKHGATISEVAAQEALTDLTTPINYLISVQIDKEKNRKLYGQNNAGCSQNRRNAAQFFLNRGAHFNQESPWKNFSAAFCKPCVQIDMYQVGKPLTKSSALGFAVGCLMCCPCNTLATVRSCLPEETIIAATPPSAMRMEYQGNSQSPLLEPALLTNH